MRCNPSAHRGRRSLRLKACWGRQDVPSQMPVLLAPLARRARFPTFITSFFLLLGLACHHAFRGFGSMDGSVSLLTLDEPIGSCSLASVATAANNDSRSNGGCKGYKKFVEVGVRKEYRSSPSSSSEQWSELLDAMMTSGNESKTSRQGFLKAIVGLGVGTAAAAAGLPEPANALLGE